jgi:Xaa-Pro dipeptidase
MPGEIPMQLLEIQEQLRREGVDGWLFFDHHRRDPIAYRVLALEAPQHVSRRWYYWLPAEGEPRKLVHRVEPHMLDGLPGRRLMYSSWSGQPEQLRQMLGGARRVAMQYSPQCMIPYVSLVDAGTIELVRGLGVEVVSSASLVQYFEARWSQEQLESHREAGRRVDRVRGEAFAEIGRRLRSDGSVQEAEIAALIRRRFAEEGLKTDSGPVVAVGPNSSDPHYEPSDECSRPIEPGDFVLIDMWAKLDRPRAVYYDITWTGYCGEQPPAEIENVFRIVREARDRTVAFIRSAVAAGKTIFGWQCDDVARDTIREQGYGDAFMHRTGHSIGEEVHGNGANLDNLETRDERPIIAATCFSVEPGIYLPAFGLRSELDCYVSATDAGPTGEVQEQLVRIL